MAQKPATDGVCRVLVVEDNHNVRSSIVGVLQAGGYHVEDAEDVDQAVRLLGEGNVALVLLDYGVPDGTGLRLLDEVTGLPPVILMSGSGEVPVVDSRVSAFLSKPFQPARLLEEVALYLKRS